MTAATPGREELLSLIRSAFNEGFNEGGREHTTYGGGKTWAESRTLKKITELSDRLAAKPADEGVREALTAAKTAMLRTRTASIAGCEEGYGKPQLWADELFASHGDLTKAIKLCEAALSTTGEPNDDLVVRRLPRVSFGDGRSSGVGKILRREMK